MLVMSIDALGKRGAYGPSVIVAWVGLEPAGSFHSLLPLGLCLKILRIKGVLRRRPPKPENV